MTADREPQTEAGRVLYALYSSGPALTSYILAIEAEARADAAPPPAGIDVGVVADLLTEMHVRRDGLCSESHMIEAEWFASRYLARLAPQPTADPE